MESFSQDFMAILQILLPGFVAAWIFYSLTSHPKPSQFERVIQALIFTLFIQAIVAVLKSFFTYINPALWDESLTLITPIIVALLFGLVFSYFANNDKLHAFLRRTRITKETSFPSEWFGAFDKNITFVVLHFQDERRLYGWPIELPSEPTNGHFVIADPSWLGDSNKEYRITGVETILVDVNDVKWVEFLTKTWEQNNGKERV